MKKNYKVITINGFRGLIMAVFVVLGLIAGFIISPAWVCMKIWNMYVVEYFSVIPMQLYQGILLWAVIALFLYAINNKRSLIGFGTYPKLTPEQVNDIIDRAKMSDSKIISELEALQTKLQNEKTEDNKVNLNEVKENQKEEQKEEIRG